MTTNILTWDEGYDERELHSPTPDDVTGRIAALDGVDHTLVTVYRNDAHLAVGGSANEGLVVYCTFDSEVFWQVVVDGDPGASVTLVAGGQAGAYPATHVTTLGDAITAAVDFLERGERAPGLHWDAQ
ncbi:Imm1 family immunity protein [Sinomonas sp. ASV322]|uniref:Imm1 family immunity protein n=1 Tax=Sinomonas sp. ASV322 TaxID=3041920 RepID=UPI0027DCC9DF|nr:Imm1 family immunity protein [Sinomonas sp. ASV322]MDQ4504404.1 Imm1 family immunity protein [Sinomonas sp. ASV322]